MSFIGPTFWDKTNEYTRRLGINNTILATRLDVSHSTLYNYKSNPRQMPLGVFQDYCRILQLSDTERLEASKLCR